MTEELKICGVGAGLCFAAVVVPIALKGLYDVFHCRPLAGKDETQGLARILIGIWPAELFLQVGISFLILGGFLSNPTICVSLVGAFGLLPMVIPALDLLLGRAPYSVERRNQPIKTKCRYMFVHENLWSSIALSIGQGGLVALFAYSLLTNDMYDLQMNTERWLFFSLANCLTCKQVGEATDGESESFVQFVSFGYIASLSDLRPRFGYRYALVDNFHELARGVLNKERIIVADENGIPMESLSRKPSFAEICFRYYISILSERAYPWFIILMAPIFLTFSGEAIDFILNVLAVAFIAALDNGDEVVYRLLPNDLTLHTLCLAIKQGFPGDLILEAAQSKVGTRDSETDLYPFQAAAVAGSAALLALENEGHTSTYAFADKKYFLIEQSVDLCYRLLRKEPLVMQSYVTLK